MKSTCAYLIILIGLTGSLAYAAADYDRIRKDISVMSQIVRGAFDDDADCRRCKVSVDGSYLAEQGAVFTIVPSPIHLRITGSEVGEVSRFQDWDFSDLDDLAEIPAMVSEILAEVDIEIGNGRHYGTRREDGRIIDRESRGRMRAISRERRHLEEEVRDIEIDLIHSEEDERLEQEGACRGSQITPSLHNRGVQAIGRFELTTAVNRFPTFSTFSTVCQCVQWFHLFLD